LALVLKVALLNGLDLLLLLLLLLSLLLGLGLSRRDFLGGGSGGGLDRGSSSGLGGLSGSSLGRHRLSDRLSDRSLLGDLDGLLGVGHCDYDCGGIRNKAGYWGVTGYIKENKGNWVSGITENREQEKRVR